MKKKETVFLLVAHSCELKACVGVYKNKEEAEKAAAELTKAANAYEYKQTKKEQKKTEKILDKYLLSYYFGCGGIGTVRVEEIEFGQPFAKWSLD